MEFDIKTLTSSSKFSTWLRLRISQWSISSRSTVHKKSCCQSKLILKYFLHLLRDATDRFTSPQLPHRKLSTHWHSKNLNLPSFIPNLVSIGTQIRLTNLTLVEILFFTQLNIFYLHLGQSNLCTYTIFDTKTGKFLFSFNPFSFILVLKNHKK